MVALALSSYPIFAYFHEPNARTPIPIIRVSVGRNEPLEQEIRGGQAGQIWINRGGEMDDCSGRILQKSAYLLASMALSAKNRGATSSAARWISFNAGFLAAH